jgi:hypothetical protein
MRQPIETGFLIDHSGTKNGYGKLIPESQLGNL